MDWKHPEKELEALGIDTSKPGFYDNPEFLEAERGDPKFLRYYAAYIRTRQFDPAYLERAERVITHAVRFIQTRLAQTEQHGRCIDGSMVLMRFLEKQDVWCYATKGCMTIFFPESLGMDPTYFGSIVMPDNPAQTGHAWLYAPPFVVADASVRIQNYTRGEAQYLPDYVLSKTNKTCRYDVCDLVEPEALRQLHRELGRLPTLDQIDRQFAPGILDDIHHLGPVEVRHNGTRIRYVPSGASAPEQSLDEWKNLVIDGKYPRELYDEFAAELDTPPANEGSM